MKNSKESYYEDGQKDASNNEYNPPHGLEHLLGPSDTKKIVEDNDAYRKGHRIFKEQKKKNG